MKPIRVKLKSKQDLSYAVHFGSIEKDLSRAIRSLKIPVSRFIVVTSAAVQKAGHAKKVKKALSKKGVPVEIVVLPNGEKIKNIHTLNSLYAAGLRFKCDRQSCVVGVGGGVITDLAGFFAATYMRGISYISVPTTLLGMVDAAIGGKTGIDMAEGKNLVGAFWQPKMVWIDQKVLKTLPRREWITGFAEVMKYGVIKDRAFYFWLQEGLRKKPDIRKWSDKDIAKAIGKSVAIKALVVSRDEKETPLKGGREILNFGHTVGHALEAATAYQALSHGEAISVGMVAAGLIARHYGKWSDDEQLQLLSSFQVVGLPIHVPARVKVNSKRFWDALRSDKKNVSGRLRFVLPKRIGAVELKNEIQPAVLHKIVRTLGVGS